MQHWRLIYCECVALRIVLKFRLSENGIWPEKVVKFPLVERARSLSPSMSATMQSGVKGISPLPGPASP